MSGYVNQFASHNRLAQAIRDADDLVYKLQEWAEGRKGWSFREDTSDHWKSWASRVFEYPRHQGGVRLSLRLNYHGDKNRPPKSYWIAEITPAFSAGPEESITGKLSDVEGWVAEAERALSLPARLGECKNIEFATQMVGRASARDLVRLGFYLEFDNDVTTVRRRLVQDFGPKGSSRV